MWHPVRTADTRPDAPDEPQSRDRSTLMLAGQFALLMLVMGAAGFVIAKSAGQMVDRLGLSASVVGALLTAVVTSLPELVTTLAAVRRGALQLAVGGIIGGNTFDTLFLTISDVGYREGSLYHAVGQADFFWLVVGVVMTTILTLGQLYRQRRGPGGIGMESLMLLCVYGAAVAVQALLPAVGSM